jgi:endonuclease YncB( thermonuclease family)
MKRFLCGFLLLGLLLAFPQFLSEAEDETAPQDQASMVAAPAEPSGNGNGFSPDVTQSLDDAAVPALPARVSSDVVPADEAADSATPVETIDPVSTPLADPAATEPAQDSASTTAIDSTAQPVAPSATLSDPASEPILDDSSADPNAVPVIAPSVDPPIPSPEPSPVPEIVINEVMDGSEVNPQKDCWVELYNTTDAEISLDGWQIRGVTQGGKWIDVEDKAVHSIQPKEYLLVSHYTDSGSSALAVAPQIQKASIFFPNPIIDIELKDPAGATVDKAHLDLQAGDTFRSFERTSPVGDGTKPESWTRAILQTNLKADLAKTFATPEAMNSLDQPIGDVENLAASWAGTDLDLKWQNPADPRVASLNLYQQDATADGWVLVASIQPTPDENQNLRLPENWTIPQFQPATKTTFKLTTLDSLGRESQGEEVVVSPKSPILINEILAKPKTLEAKNEFIELWNSGETPIDLKGWKLGNGDAGDALSYTFNADGRDYNIQPGSFLVFFSAETGLSLDNSGGTAILYDPDGDVADRVDFPMAVTRHSWGRDSEKPDEWIEFDHPTPDAANIEVNHEPIPVIKTQGDTRNMTLNVTGEDSTDPDGDALTYLWEFETGATDARENPTQYTYSAPGEKTVTLTVTDEYGLSATATTTFTASEPVASRGGGSGGGGQKIYPSIQPINEFLPNPSGVDTENEWLELWNNTSSAVDLGGWTLASGSDNRFKIPEGTVLQPNAFQVFNAPQLTLSMKNDSDEIRLLDPNKEVRESVPYAGAKENWSYAKRLDGSFGWTDQLTPGAENQFPQPPRAYRTGDVVFESVLPNPEGKDEGNEEIQLKNNGAEAINLEGWSLTNLKGKTVALPTLSIAPGDRLVIKTSDIGLTLVNAQDRLTLLDPKGNAIDSIEWEKAVEGEKIYRPDFVKDDMEVSVLKVVDGDTFKALVDGVELSVRLIGVDTPETVDPDLPVQYFGKEASDYLKQRLEGQTVRLAFENGKWDAYGRLLAYVYVGDQLINAELVEKGYGFAYTVFPFRYMEEFKRLESEAKENRRGLWADPDKAEEVLRQKLKKKKAVKEEKKAKEKEEVKINQDCMAQGLKILSILPNAQRGKSSEFIRLVNDSEKPVCLQGWSLDDRLDGGSKPYAIENGSMAPKTIRTFYKNETKISLNNLNDCATLLDPLGTTADQICYGKTHPGEHFTHMGGNWKPKGKIGKKGSQKRKKSAKAAKKQAEVPRSYSDYLDSLKTETWVGLVRSVDTEKKILVFETGGRTIPISYAAGAVDVGWSSKLVDLRSPVELEVRKIGSAQELVAMRPAKRGQDAPKTEPKSYIEWELALSMGGLVVLGMVLRHLKKGRK